jgi:FkbM family methyltransferase
MKIPEKLKTYVRSSPRIWDALRKMQRNVLKQNDPAYDFFRNYTRSHDGRVNFVQIGANDGLRNDPFREFIVQKGWKGILVEPLPDVLALLKRNYAAHRNKLRFVNAAITATDGSMTFFGFSENLLNSLSIEKRLDYQRKASFSRTHVEHYVPQQHRWGITETQVQCLSMTSLLQQHWNGEPIHLLAIDAEGHEPNIIKAIDFDTFKPETIFYESHTLGDSGTELAEFLRTKGYETRSILGDTVATLIR